MKCPTCGKKSSGREECWLDGARFAYFCVCGNEWGHVKAIDPTELLELIEKAEDYTTHDEIYEAVKLCLSGSWSPLKKLAGGEQRKPEHETGTTP